ncbi:MAG: monovalent cation/H+ antiporter subunit A [Cereibacter sphaeroides]|uniref:Monovalent cation/H+ antiporter subunit A n=1 Tax=Cereibacter sphaeroides TaxID=1063 RepID=A0A2W5U0L9_CERSP|nr:MAG: monovalent cation/H+ antiporter subunit A [Cereibacter sphaeroides]
MSLALIAAIPFLGAILPGLMIRSGRDACALSAGLMTALALLLVGINAPAVLRGEVVQTRIDWLPQLGLNANFMLDGLGLLFAVLILGIGLLIILYARYYLAATDPMGRFFTFLMLFQGAMLGIVLSDNILLLLVFWELTSLSSFLLIGYWNHVPAAGKGARMALVVTGMGGLSMIAGMLILGHVAGSFDLSVILTEGEAIQSSPWYLPALLLILLGCFTKSAQFPFHFWLPHAMAAPTPVSAYLHSATMVKAGIFLMARLWPVMSGTPEWFYLVATTGLVTMVMGAVIALFKNDLKAILAFSTVSQLGLITMLLGFGTAEAAVAAVLHIMSHASFKAALFMSAGIIDHEAHTRDIRRLGGLRTLMPITFTFSTIAALSMAGIPPLNGFLSKEMMLEAADHAVWAANSWLISALAVIGATFSVAYSFRFIGQVFLGPVREDYPHRPHDPQFGLWVAPALLAALVIVSGLAPMAIFGWLAATAADAVTGGVAVVKITHWHGFVPAFWMSLGAIAGGLSLALLHQPLSRFWAAMRIPAAKPMFEGVLAAATKGAERLTGRWHDGSLTRAFAVGIVVMAAAGVWAFSGGAHLPGARAATPAEPVALAGWILLCGATISVALVHRNRLLSLVLVGVVGLMVSVAFIYLSAPDLALTQISVEVATVILLLLALNFLPKITMPERRSRLIRDAVIAGVAGLGAGALILALMLRDFAFPSIAAFHIANAKTEGGGTNIVNVILVDFRGYDTFGEITVLGIAALVIYALAEAILRGGPANDRLLAWPQPKGRAGDRHPMMFVVITRLILPVALMVGVFMFLRGHNKPGGGFIAGLIVAIAYLMQYMASGFAWAAARQRIPHHALIGGGVLVACATGIGAWFNGMPFLTSAYAYVTIPPLDKFELATAALFDLGVFLCVLGAVMLALASISRLAIRAGETVNTRPFDIDPSGKGGR